MDLKIKDVCRLLNISEKELKSRIKNDKIPSYEIQHQYYFNKAEIHEWILKNRIPVSKNLLEMSLTNEPVFLFSLLNKGGIFFGIEGKDIRSVIKNSVKNIRIPQGLSGEYVVSTLLEREEMMPTAIGKGFAIPHPRNPIVSDTESESVSLCVLKNKIDFGALDGLPVNAIFIVLCANARRHLEILSKISYLCQQDEFCKMFKKPGFEKEILEYIEKKEKDLIKR